MITFVPITICQLNNPAYNVAFVFRREYEKWQRATDTAPTISIVLSGDKPLGYVMVACQPFQYHVTVFFSEAATVKDMLSAINSFIYSVNEPELSSFAVTFIYLGGACYYALKQNLEDVGFTETFGGVLSGDATTGAGYFKRVQMTDETRLMLVFKRLSKAEQLRQQAVVTAGHRLAPWLITELAGFLGRTIALAVKEMKVIRRNG